MGTNSDLPFWQVNVLPDSRQNECPEYLRNLSEKDKSIIGTRDEEFKFTEWPQVKDYIRTDYPIKFTVNKPADAAQGTNRIDLFVRKPTDLRRYREYTHRLVQDYGSIMNFVVNERLHWTDLTAQGLPFTDLADLKILYNDWPYGIDPSIAHLVVWTKFVLEDDPVTDDLTPAARQQVDEFVARTFCSRVPAQDVIWFKNWRSLKSVHAVEHFHVMLNKAPADFLEQITGGDVPLAAQWESAAAPQPPT